MSMRGGQEPARPARLPATWLIRESSQVDSQQWDERYSGTEFEWTTQPNQFVAAELAGLRPGQAIDLAAGEGRNTVWLAERGWRVTAVDFSRVGLEKGQKLSAARGIDPARVDWIVADLRDYEPGRGAYDLALIAYLQVGRQLRAAVLARAAAALRPGGTVFVVGHDLANLTEGVGGPQDPQVLYSPDAVSAELSGLTVVRAERVHRTVDREGGPVTAVDTLVRAVRQA
jgi:SAM-dependent methyltransferase